MKHFTTIILSLFAVLTTHSQDTLKLSEFNILNNSSWKGQLTYKDYQSGNLTSIDATMQIVIKGEKIVTKVQYVYEPNKNHKSSVKIKKQGTYFGNEKVISNTIKDGLRTFVTTYEGLDDGKKATIFLKHAFNEKMYKLTKEVQYKNSSERMFRNSYEFKKL